MSEETSLADLLNLNLHNFEDEVHNIVDKAIKEMAMERMLKELEVPSTFTNILWSSFIFFINRLFGPVWNSNMRLMPEQVTHY